MSLIRSAGHQNRSGKSWPELPPALSELLVAIDVVEKTYRNAPLLFSDMLAARIAVDKKKHGLPLNFIRRVGCQNRRGVNVAKVAPCALSESLVARTAAPRVLFILSAGRQNLSGQAWPKLPLVF